MVLISPRIHFYEINDQSWYGSLTCKSNEWLRADRSRFPAYFRAKVQAGLTLMWSLGLPLIRSSSPAALVARTLQEELGDSISEYTYVDFCAGAGGPTPFIEQDLNRRLGFARLHTKGINGASSIGNGGVDFVLTDIAPHLEAWEIAAHKSDNMHYISQPVDAANAPKDLLKRFQKKGTPNKKVFRLFNLAFHHFDNPLAARILRNSIETSDGFGIFELQERTISSMIVITLMWPLLLLVSPFYFWRDPGHLFFTYIIPIIPFVLVFDGYISSLRTRTPDEIMQLMGRTGETQGWEFGSGRENHTWPIGEMSWFIGTKTK
jgi:hypothetical protein